jgi:hypothetical protein
VVERRAHHPRLIVQQPVALLALAPDHLGDVGLQMTAVPPEGVRCSLTCTQRSPRQLAPRS